ncbi:MAG: hypothetical protein KAS32_22680 [Candidatus Peribacteraceae bacterium]|nr:hypothetical protein [Candidatus Peribacteraceae bacterium]
MKIEDVTPEMLKSAKDVIDTRKITESIRSIVETNQNHVLFVHQFKAEKDIPEEVDRIVLEGKLSYLLSDNDFKTYIEESTHLNELAGLKVDNPEHCPLLVAEGVEREKISDMFVSFEPMSGVKASDLHCNPKFYKRAVDLYLNLYTKLNDIEK